MKIRVFSNITFFLILLCFNYLIFAQTESKNLAVTKIDTPKVVEEQPKFYRVGNVFIGGQPDKKTLKWFSEKGVTTVINNRTAPENEKQTDEKFDEQEYVEELGMKYVNIPLGGKDGYTPEAVEIFANAINESEGKILIHCTMGGRACHLWSAYLVKHKNYSIDDALSVGKQMMLSFPFEKMLGYELTMKKRE
jgi:uncharacterized protein (TIGR01244 family)